MSMMASRGSLDHRTVKDIRAKEGRCGCHTTGRGRGRWYICDYHEGFDAALDSPVGVDEVQVEQDQHPESEGGERDGDEVIRPVGFPAPHLPKDKT